MPKAILEFDLDKAEDLEAHKDALNATEYKSNLWEISEALRNFRKHCDSDDVDDCKKLISRISNSITADLY